MSNATEVQDTTDCSLCPNCGKYISNVSFNIHTMRCARFNVRCPECFESVPRTALEEHRKEKHIPIPCDQCGEMLLKADMQFHKDHSCPEGLVQCTFCQLNVLRKKLEEHQAVCGSRSTKCPVCGASVPKNMLDRHISLGCSMPHRPGSPVQRPGSPVQRPGSPVQRPGSPVQRPGSPVHQGSGSSQRDPITIPDDEPRRNLTSSGTMCPKCGGIFSIEEIIDHAERCGKPTRASDNPPQAQVKTTTHCPLCNKAFPNSEIVEHAARCKGNASITIPDDEPDRSRGSGRSQLKESTALCPLCNKAFPYSEIVDHAARCKGNAPVTVYAEEPDRNGGGDVECPTCHQFFDITQIVEHTERCGQAPAFRRPEPARPAPAPKREESLVCPFCKRGGFASEPEYLSHMTECQNSSSRRLDAYSSNDDNDSSRRRHESDVLTECPFCHRFRSHNPTELQNHINKCASRSGSGSRGKRWRLFGHS